MHYALISIDDLWARRYDIGEGNTYSSFGVSDGNCPDIIFKCDENAAETPWGWDDITDGSVLKGEFFFDPAKLVAWYFDGLGEEQGEFSHVYKSNRYLDDLRAWRQDLQPGDLLLSRSEAPIGWAIGPLGLGFWSHVGIYMGNGKVVEAVGEGVIESDITTWDYPSKDCVEALRVVMDDGSPIDETVRSGVVSFVSDQIGDKYDPFVILGKKSANYDSDFWYCSELAWAAYLSQGINIEDTPDKNAVLPQEINDDNNTSRIGLHIESVVSLGDLAIALRCPADLVVTDPDGLTISIESNEIPGAAYIVDDFDGDGDADSVVGIRDRKPGDYLIRVVPHFDAAPTDTYTLQISMGETTIVIAQDHPIGEIPQQPYVVESDESEISVVPIADANSPSTGMEGSPLLFDGSASYDPDGSIAQYEWDFGDSSIGFGIQPTHAYGDNGIYTVTLTVTDDDGLSSTDTTEVTVANVPPTVHTMIAPPDPVAVNNPVNAWGNFTDPGWLDTHTATWHWGDGTTSDGIVTKANGSGNVTGSHTYNCPGVYTITLSVIDDDGDIGTATATVTIAPQSMKAFVIKNLAIQWAPHKPGWQGSDSFSIFGRLQLPQGYTWASLQNQATVTITIAGKSGNDTVVLKGKLYGKPQSTLWSYRGSEQPPGYGMNINNMIIWWTPQGANWNGWAGFYIGGVLQLPEPIGINTTPANVKVTLEIPLTTAAGCGSLAGEQTVTCKVYKPLNLWTYNVWPNLPSFPYEPTGRE